MEIYFFIFSFLLFQVSHIVDSYGSFLIYATWVIQILFLLLLNFNLYLYIIIIICMYSIPFKHFPTTYLLVWYDNKINFYR